MLNPASALLSCVEFLHFWGWRKSIAPQPTLVQEEHSEPVIFSLCVLRHQLLQFVPELAVFLAFLTIQILEACEDMNR